MSFVRFVRPGAATRVTARRQRGAALLMAMVILTVVSTLAAGMVWQQVRAVQLEAAERARVQSGWILGGALDWARLILREDARPKPGANASAGNAASVDHLREEWATPLAEARLSSFLAVDRDNNADSGPEAFLSGAIVDAQSRYNLRNLLDAENKLVPAEVRVLERVMAAANVQPGVAGQIAEGLRAAWVPAEGSAQGAADSAPLAPVRLRQLAWLGLEANVLARLEPFLVLLPAPTPVNVNTAPREVLVAVLEGLDLGTAERLVQLRDRTPFESLEALRKELPEAVKTEEARVSVGSSYFEVFGRLRLEERVLEERSLVERRGAAGAIEVLAVLRERRSFQAVTP